MLALTFFGILHVPINVPALGLTTGEDNVDVDRELRAHGYSNALSGLCGSIQVTPRLIPMECNLLTNDLELPCLHQLHFVHEEWR